MFRKLYEEDHPHAESFLQRPASHGHLAPPDTPLIEKVAKYHTKTVAPNSFSFGVAVCFTVNYIMGCGFLSVPWAFYSSGYALGAIVIILVSWVMNITKNYLLESMARAEALTVDSYIEEADPVYEVTNRKFEITELVGKYAGRPGKVFYVFILCLYMYGSLWAYTSVFASSFASNVGLVYLPACDIYSAQAAIGDNCHAVYAIYACMFGVVVVFISTLELKEQVGIQVIMTVLRMLAVALMLGTVLLAGTDKETSPFPEARAKRADVVAFNPAGTLHLLPIAVYSQVFHHSIPDHHTPRLPSSLTSSLLAVLAEPVRDKKQLSHIFGTAFVVCGVMYTLLGATVASYFGDQTGTQSNLNWTNYRVDSNPALAAIRWFIVLFPAFDVVSAFPLNAITLGNNLMAAWHGDKTAKVERDKMRRLPFRLLAAVPPVIGAVFFSNLGSILDFTGIIGILLTLTIPPCLHLLTTAAVRKRWGDDVAWLTIYSDCLGSHIPVAWTVMLGSLVVAGFVFASLILKL